MVKKLLTLVLGVALSIGAMAQWGASNPTVSQDDILFWTGTGSNRAVVAVTWVDGDENIGVAWGVQWNGDNVLMRDIMDTIATYDSRFVISWNSTHSYINDLSFVDPVRELNLTGMFDEESGMAWWFYNWKDSEDNTKESAGVMGDVIAAGDFVDWIDMDPETYGSNPADTMIMADDPSAPVEPVEGDANIDASEILYWIGEGSNEVVFAVNWAAPDTCLAWGFRFDGTATVEDVMDAITTNDPRFAYSAANGIVEDIIFDLHDDVTLLQLSTGSYWMYDVNGSMAPLGYQSMELADGDFVKWGDAAVATVVGMWENMYWTTPVTPVDDPNAPVEPLAEDATIEASAILYWVGEGSNSAIVAVNWAAPDTCLAWGFRFNGSATLKDAMDAIAAADPRFSYTYSGSMLSDIVYTDGNLTLQLTTESSSQWGNYWSFNVNGSLGMSYFDALQLVNGDFVKWGDPNSGTVAGQDEWGYDILVWTTTVTPATVPAGIASVEYNSLSVYPNPATDRINVVNTGAATTACLFDQAGRRVMAMTLANGDNSVSLGSLSNGVYMLRMGDSVTKIVVRH